MLEKIVLEQFVEGLPAATSDWVLCHRPADLAGAITLAEDHLAPTGLSRRSHAGTPAEDPRRGPAATGVALDPQRAPQAAGQECWRCGQLGHFRGECPLMEVGQVFRVAGPPAPSPGPGGTYSVPVRIQGGTHRAMVDLRPRYTRRSQAVARQCDVTGGR
ncbi:hypothetical protein N1851_033974 [Merluccius polli]|uniref:CCHC-type domain-containing protein n=1 Tax=Merluccius polli TaxID=89951 RepID=A0AA47M0E3_MERPO|nr:hypothetical protein N1851_033974 [Merluccius polli]